MGGGGVGGGGPARRLLGWSRPEMLEPRPRVVVATELSRGWVLDLFSRWSQQHLLRERGCIRYCGLSSNYLARKDFGEVLGAPLDGHGEQVVGGSLEFGGVLSGYGVAWEGVEREGGGPSPGLPVFRTSQGG